MYLSQASSCLKRSFQSNLAVLKNTKVGSLWKRNEKFAIQFSKNLIINALPRVFKPLSLLVSNAYSTYQKINQLKKEFFDGPVDVSIEGLDPRVQEEVVKSLDLELSQFIPGLSDKKDLTNFTSFSL